MSGPVLRPPVQLDLATPKRIHVCNVGGAGMSAIATLLAQMGHDVSGVDANGDDRTPFLGPLRDLGVAITVGDAGLGDGSAIDVVVTSTATPPDHPDVARARAAGATVAHRSDALAGICALRRVSSVSGTHGKSTTAGMLATIHAGSATGAGLLVGTRVTGLGTNADWSSGPGLVVEADESDGSFLRTNAHHAVVTNVEADHLSYWHTEDRLVAAFGEFVAGASGTVVLCLDDPGSAALAGSAGGSVLTYGVDPRADLVIADIAPHELGVACSLDTPAGGVDLVVPCAPGIHNARNAAAAVAAAMADGVPPEESARALAGFAGVARRFEPRGEFGGVTFVDSYDHLPTEVSAALLAASQAEFSRVVCVFQPHRYTRTRDLAHTFADAFTAADVLAVTDLYDAGEAPIDGVSGRLVHDAVVAAHPDADVHFTGDLDATEDWLAETLRPGDLCLTLNAGDLTTMPDRMARRLGGEGA